jgi:hypothetical protein
MRGPQAGPQLAVEMVMGPAETVMGPAEIAQMPAQDGVAPVFARRTPRQAENLRVPKVKLIASWP